MSTATSTQTGLRRAVLLTVAALSASAIACEREPSGRTVVVRGGHFLALDAEGRELPASALPGSELRISDGEGRSQRLRIDEVLDESEPASPVGLYTLSRFDEAEQRWVPHCRPGPDGLTAALPLPGHWSADGSTFTEDLEGFGVTCSAGANGKCMRMGYVPGLVVGGERLTPYFVACVRMMRADYCGDGRSHTEAGRPVDFIDRLGRQGLWHDGDKRFEAAWGVDGAICVERTRVPEHTDLEQLGELCPRLRERATSPCSEDTIDDDASVLLVNRS
ncbi:MAG: hypothetical protein KC457_01955 [Myxococcales bacterium]|nr:hypothetical protein [Myxococcales bacterium]